MRWLLASMSTRCNCTSHTVIVNDIRSDLCSGSLYTDGCLGAVDDVALVIVFYFLLICFSCTSHGFRCENAIRSVHVFIFPRRVSECGRST